MRPPLTCYPARRSIRTRTNETARALWAAAGERAYLETGESILCRERIPALRHRGIARACRMMRL